jgi:NAD(P)-dependent dehydrogenase (short-subunit alcohol dehydrogenase family)
MRLDLEGRTAVVTGASRGIGLAVARTLVTNGASVVLTSRDPDVARDAAASLASPRAIGLGAHAADTDAAEACARSAVERFGSLDILVSNAGTNPAHGPLVEQDRSRFMKTFEVNSWGPVLWAGAAWRAWMREHGGAIINITSVGAYLVADQLGTYGASKAALTHLTDQLAAELAPGVRVNAVAPGVVRTKLSGALWDGREAEAAADTLLGRIGEPDDVASMVAFLASDQAAWMTGEVIVLDGGQRLLRAPR